MFKVDYISHFLTSRSRKSKLLILLTVDFFLLLFSFCTSSLLLYSEIIFFQKPEEQIFLLFSILGSLFIFFILKIYNVLTRYIDLEMFKKIFNGTLISSILILLTSTIITDINNNLFYINFFIMLILVSGSRFLARELFVFSSVRDHQNNVAIYGAGSAGRQLFAQLKLNKSYSVKFFIDDSVDFKNRSLQDLKIYSYKELGHLIKKYKINIVLVAISKLSREQKNKIYSNLEKLNVQVKKIPGLNDIISGKKIEDIRSINANDLLGREKVKPDEKLLRKNITKKKVMITGAGGSIGRILSEKVLQLLPKELILIDHSEFALYSIDQKINNLKNKHNINTKISKRLSTLQSLENIFTLLEDYKPDTLFHVAAYKHVPLLEENISEAIKNNYIVTKNLGEASIKAGVSSFTLISTDKAVRPTNIMGASKRISELIIQNNSLQKTNTDFSIVRFGNVLGSSGSVIPLFNDQIYQGGPVTVTDRNITRYIMSIDEASELVIQASSLSKNDGSIFVLDMGEPIKITELAERLIRLNGLKPTFNQLQKPGEIKITFSGLRKGEKMYEELSYVKNLNKTSHERIFIEEILNLNWSKILSNLKEIEELSKNNQDEKIRKLLEHMLFEYN
tara:strand:+ start:27453 stop:29318 length:1866 start_codon:yes stop_codon:yes gene_type:complete